jgi:hypothetical protein
MPSRRFTLSSDRPAEVPSSPHIGFAKPDLKPGQVFGSWTVLAYAGRTGVNRMRPRWNCQCVCRTYRSVLAESLSSGRSRSCGCIRVTTHGMSDRPLYKTWRHVLDRCYVPETVAYPRFGARGITICERWLNSPVTFVSDIDGEIGSSPGRGWSLDMAKKSGNFEPGNVRWVSPREQRENRLLKKRSRLTWGQIEEIRICHASGQKQSRIAREYGISQSRVSDIATGKTWTLP